MAGVARTNGIGHAHETLYSTANLAFYTIDIGTNLNTEQGIGKALEGFAQAINPLAMNSEGTAGKINVIVDGSQWDKLALETVLINLGSAYGPNAFDFENTVATVGGQFIVSA